MAIAAPALVGTKGFAAGAIILACLPPVLAQTARNLGKRLEPDLWTSWGGPPTTRLLRHRDRTVSENTKTRYFAALGRSANIVRPTPEEEVENPSAADSVYASAGDWLRPMTRAHAGSSLVAAKNASYGFARNLLGIRWLGFGLAVATMVCMGAVAFYRWGNPEADFQGPIFAVVAALGCAAIWVFGVNSGSVRSAADAYARALLECCDTMPASAATKAPTAKRKQPEGSASKVTNRKTASNIQAGEQE